MMNSQTSASVLIVEDESIIAANIRELLLGLGYDPFATASTSEEAMAYAVERCPDVVLMDIRIKGKVDGIATAELLRDRFDTAIVYLTAHADDATIARAKRTQPLGYLIKPIKPSELHSAIEVALYKHAMDRQLREREHWLSTTLRSIADGVVMTDLAGKITFMNPAAEVLFGMTLEQAVGRPARDVMRLAGREWPSGETPIDVALREQRSIHIAELVLEGSGGSNRVISDSSAPVVDEHEVLGAVMVFHDVTEQRQLQKQLELADRLSSLGTMAAGVAHEINNPLAAVVGNAEIVLESLAHVAASASPGEADVAAITREAGTAIDAQHDVLSAASRIARIVTDLGVFSRREPQPSGLVDVRKAIEWAARATAHELRHRARLSTKLEAVPLVEGDEMRLAQVFVNLLINAAHAIEPGDAEGNHVSVTAQPDAAGSIIVEVCDTGSGIAPEALPHIFEPYFTTKAPGVGTGLGLSICHSIVASMRGELTVESRVGEGTTFRIRLPAGSGKEPAVSSPPPPVSNQRLGRLLIIDDEDIVLKTLVRIFDEHDVVATADAREALARLQRGETFDVIFCDLMMPNMTGVDFYEALLGSCPEMAKRVVFLTGGAVTPRGEQFLATVPNVRVQKPFTVAALRNLVQGLLSEGGSPSNTDRPS